MPRKKQRRQVTAPVDGLQAANDWIEGRGKQFFESVASWRWYVFHHKRQLIEAGALLEIAGQFYVDEAKMLETIRAIGTETIKRRIEARTAAEASRK